MSGKVASNMAYIQQLFMTVQQHVSDDLSREELLSFLDAEPAEFRSIAYESASHEIAMKDIRDENSLLNWQEFYENSKEHSFHIQIGLGWAFAKTETYPPQDLIVPGSIMRLMISDGIGYFNGLFRGRKTIKLQMIPEGLHPDDVNGFDQGLGRRLWYLNQGVVEKVADMIMAFPQSRRSDLWRGVGIACGYVGGNSISNLHLISDASRIHLGHLRAGIALAAESRYDSNTMTQDIESACQIICKRTVEEVLNIKNKLKDQQAIVNSNHIVHAFEKMQLESINSKEEKYY